MWCKESIFMDNMECKTAFIISFYFYDLDMLSGKLKIKIKQYLTVKQSSIATVIYLWGVEALLWDNRATAASRRGLQHTAQPQWGAFCLGKPQENHYRGSKQQIVNCSQVITVSLLLSRSFKKKNSFSHSGFSFISFIPEITAHILKWDKFATSFRNLAD